MFSTVDKAIAAILGGLISFLAMRFGLALDFLTPEVINTLSVMIAGILAWAVPNKPRL